MSREPHLEIDKLVNEGLAALLLKSGKTVPILTDDLRLDDLGLASIDVTTLIVDLSRRLGSDTVDTGATELEIATVGDLRRVFAPGAGAGANTTSDLLAASRRRAEARRTGTR